MTNSIAIIGTAMSTRAQANWEPPEVERWGLGGVYVFLDKLDRYIEIHTEKFLKARTKARVYVKYHHWLQSCGIPIYMINPDPRIKTSVAFPYEEIIQHFFWDYPDKPYLTSSIAMLMALALWEADTGQRELDELKLFGIDMAVEMEYKHQKAGCTFFVGWARAKGIKVTIPDGSVLMAAPIYGKREESKVTIEDVDVRLLELKRDVQLTEIHLTGLRAQVKENEHWKAQLEGVGDAAPIPTGDAVILNPAVFPKDEKDGHKSPVALPS